MSIDKLFSHQCGYAAIVDGCDDLAGFDSADEMWVRRTALANAAGRGVTWLRVASDVTAAWSSGDWSRPIEVDLKMGEIYFAGQGVAAAIFAGRRAALEAALMSASTPGMQQ